jgi:hypothetical protein
MMANRMRLTVAGPAALAAVLAVASATTGSAHHDSGDGYGGNGRYEVGLFGDMPYGEYGRAHYPAVIAGLNQAPLAFSVFDGDLKNGSEPCYADHDGSAQAAGKPDVYKYALGYFQQLRAPLVAVPGDNEWTDCDRAKITPHFDANDRLAYLRTLLYPSDRSLGKRTIRLTRQSAAYPENVRWTAGPVTYVGVNVPGSDNNWVDPARDGTKEGPADEAQAEYTARNQANLGWLAESFAAAKQSRSKAIMIVIQADMWDPEAAAKGTLVHYADTKAALARLTIGFGEPVVLVNGDSHSFEIDKPLMDAATTNAAGADGPNVIENFTRVTTFGEYQNHWVSATVDPDDPNVFSFHAQLIQANLPTYTPPA